jgi:hypothetical protein
MPEAMPGPAVTGDADPRLVRFLLGTLPEAEYNGIEAALFSDEQLQQEVDSTADDLIQAYLAGTLSNEERASFEAFFLASPGHQERLAFVRDLITATHRAGRERPASGRQVRWLIAAAAVIAALAAFAGLVWRKDGPREAQGPTPAPERTSLSPSPGARGSPAPGEDGPVRSVRLPSAAGARPSEVLLTTGTRTVRLEVEVWAGPPSFDATVRDEKGREAWRVENVAPSAPGRPLVLSVPASVFGSGDYVLEVDSEPLRDESPAAPLKRRLRIVRVP